MTVWRRSDFVFADGVRILPYFLYAEKKKASAWALAACEHFALYVFCEITTVSCPGQEEGTSMETTATTPHAQHQQLGWEHRLQAVLALLRGEPVPQVTARFGMGRSILYK